MNPECSSIRVQILHEAIYVLNSANTLRKVMDQFILPPAMDK